MLFYLLIVVAIAFGVYKLLTEVLKMKGFLVWLIVILVAFFNIFINVGISIWAKETGTWTYEETTTKVVAATIQQVQVSKSSSDTYIIWTDASGKTHETVVDDATIIDSDEWKMVERRGDIEEFILDILHDERTEYVFYVPINVLYPNMAQ